MRPQLALLATGGMLPVLVLGNLALMGTEKNRIFRPSHIHVFQQPWKAIIFSWYNYEKKIYLVLGHFLSHFILKLIVNKQFSIENCFKFKYLVPNVLQSCVVYKFSCGECTSMYIGRDLSPLVDTHCRTSMFI